LDRTLDALAQRQPEHGVRLAEPVHLGAAELKPGDVDLAEVDAPGGELLDQPTLVAVDLAIARASSPSRESLRLTQRSTLTTGVDGADQGPSVTSAAS
jgi:hypothetical protein